MSFDYLMGYIMSISMCMQNFITIFHSIQEIGSFSLFQNLELSKASTDVNVISQSLGLDLVNINVYAKVYQNIPLSLRDRAIFADDKCHFATPWATSCQYQCVCKIYQNIPNGLRVIDIFRHFSRTGRHQNLHKLSGDKIKCLIIGNS